MTPEEHVKLIQEIYSKNREEINVLAGSGMFNSIIKGYCLFALEEAGITDVNIDFNRLFDDITASEARAKGE